MDLPEFEFQSWENSFNDTYFLYELMKQDNYKPDVIIGIARGGWIPSRLLADFFGVSMIVSIKLEFYSEIGKTLKDPIIVQPLNVDIQGKNVLLVDDIADTGKSLALAFKHVQEFKPASIKTMTLYYKPHSIIVPDYYYKTTTAWVVFPWEYYEFMNEIIPKIRQGKTRTEIMNWLKNTGVPGPIVNSYFVKEEQ